MKKLVLFLISFGIYSLAGAQVTDFQIWTGPIIRYNITKKIRADFEQQIRFNENASQYDFTFSELSLKYKVFKYLDLKAVFRQSFIPSGGNSTEIAEHDKSRVCFDASTSTKLFNSGINAGYRIRYQNSWENSTLATKQFIRNRIEIGYNLSKPVDPYLSWDSFFRLDGRNKFSENRYTFGLMWKVAGKINIDSYFHYQKEINVKNPETNYILGIGLVYEIH